MTMFNPNTATPMMAQWHQCREKAKGALLLFRMGDFYEAFYEDAVILAKALELTLTKRQEIPMSGIPHHAFQNYIDRLLSQGIKVAVAEQTEDPKKAKGLVKRDVVRIITPGTLIQSNLLEAKAHNYIASLCQIGSRYGLAFLDVSTADFRVLETDDLKTIQEELYSYSPSEIILSKKLKSNLEDFLQTLALSFSPTLSPIENWHFDAAFSMETLSKHFKVQSLDGYGLKGMVSATNSAGALINYLTDHLCLNIDHIQSIQKIEQKDHLLLDHITLSHLEIVKPQHIQNKGNTLLNLIDHTQTPMGARLLREWVLKPLLSIEKIIERQNGIETLLNEPTAMASLKEKLSSILDLERLMMRVASSVGSARDFNALKLSIEKVPEIKKELENLSSKFLQNIFQDIKPLDEFVSLVENAITNEPPLKLGEGKTFNEGYNSKLDEYRKLNSSSKTWLAEYQAKLKETYDIKTLKVGYNRVFGYYIEVSKGQAHLVPSSFHRRQTLANNERFISDELKEFETKVLSAEEKISQIENRLFEELREKILTFQDPILNLAHLLSKLDALLSLALLAEKKHYIKPIIDESATLKIEGGRHPILDHLCNFIPNNTFLDDDQNQLAIITGPNMAGKSTYIRQVALLVIMAQMGSYIPAESAHIGIVEKIFSRIGASDDLAKGQSTFMVEMVETANILNNLSDKSLIILDEIGRGTSTYDGIAIAQSTAEFLLSTKAKTLFATHYSELTKLSEKNKGVVNYTVAVHEDVGKITFLYKIVLGCTDKSYGIHVAELAGLPKKLILRAGEILSELEQQKKQTSTKKSLATQLEFLSKAMPSKIEEEIDKIDLDHITPLEALLKLQELKKCML